MAFHLALGEAHDSEAIATMVGELLNEIMAVVSEKSFGFDYAETVEQAHTWMKEERYAVVLARVDAQAGRLSGSLRRLCTIDRRCVWHDPGVLVRAAYRSQGIAPKQKRLASTEDGHVLKSPHHPCHNSIGRWPSINRTSSPFPADEN